MEKLESKSIENIFALTPMQEGILFHYLQEPQSRVYVEQLCLEISGEIDMPSFEKAWNQVIKTNEMLRTVFRWEKLEKPSQLILKEHQCRVLFYDLSENEDSQVNQAKEALDAVKRKDRDEGFDLQDIAFRVILCKLATVKYEIIISNHHILYDGWSTGIILREFFKAYHELTLEAQEKPGKQRQNLKELTVKPSFKEFLKWQQSQAKNEQEKFWKDYLTAFETPPELPIKRKGDKTRDVDNYTLVLPNDIIRELNFFVKNNHITLASVFYTSWGILLQKYCGIEDIIFGTTVSGRSAGIKGIEDMVGLFINTIPLRIETVPNEAFNDLLLRIDTFLHVREEFENTPLVDIKNYSHLESSESLFNTIVVIENYPLDSQLLPANSSLAIHSYSIVEMTHYDLTLSIRPFHTIEVKFSFRQDVFAKEDIQILGGRYERIIRHIIENPGTGVSQLEIISAEEKSRVLYEFNNTEKEYPTDKTIEQLFERQVEQTPDRIAVLGHGQTRANTDNNDVETLRATSLQYQYQTTYHELNEQSNRLAGCLIEKGVLADSVVGMMIDRSVEMIIGIWGILKAGGVYLPIDPGYPRERIDYMLSDSGTAILLTDYEEQKTVNCQLLTGKPQTSLHQTADVLHDSHFIYLIYTSGSTGKPKGSMITKEGFLNLLYWYMSEFGIGEEDNNLLIAPVSFDLAQKNLFSPFLTGGRMTLSAPGIPDYRELTGIIQKDRITMINCAPSVFYPLVEWNADTGFSELRSLRVVVLGGETILLDRLLPWVKSGAFHSEIINTYGPTECTDIATFYRIPGETEAEAVRSQTVITIGKPVANVQIYILDKYLQVLPVKIPGELCIGGIGVSQGYYNNKKLTEEKFAAVTHLPAKKIYHTGDLARWLPDGNIEFLGRIDQQVKIRGYRVEAAEIENQLMKHEAVKEAVVVSRQAVAGEGGENVLCAYIVPRDGHERVSISIFPEYLKQQLPGYMVPSYFVYLERIPLTPSGKIDRRSLPEPVFHSGKNYAAPRNPGEEKLLKIWCAVLDKKNLNVPIGIDDHFFRLGGHSLKATSLVSRIFKEFNIKIPLTEIFKRPTIRELFDYMKGMVGERGRAIESIEPVEEKEYYVLSSAQKRLYFLQQLEPHGITYNITAAWVVEGIIDKPRLEQSFFKLAAAHESLRTSFFMVGNEPVQKVHGLGNLGDRGQGAWGIEEKLIEVFGPTFFQKGGFIRPFDLLQAPLLRVGLVKLAEEKHLLIVDMHHIISDGMSTEILTRELAALYQGGELPVLRVRYRDYAQWQDRMKEGEGFIKQGRYWLQEFAGEIPVLAMPVDFPRPVVQEFAGDRTAFTFETGTAGLLNNLALETGATLYMVLLALYNIFLAKLSGCEDIVIGTPAAGRRYADLENIVGMFVNTLVLRNHPVGEKPFLHFLGEVKEKTLKAFENQDYQYEDLVGHAAVNVNRDTGRNPLFDTMFVLQNTGSSEINIPGLTVTPYDFENKTAKFDLTLIVKETAKGLELTFEYRTKLFKPATINRFIIYFKTIISGVLADKYREIAELELIPVEEKNRVLYEFNNTAAEYPRDKTIHQLFVEQAAKTPDYIAIVENADVEEKERRREEEKNGGVEKLCATSLHITYLQLNKHADYLAGLLIAKGALPDTIVAIMMERSLNVIIGILGILKSGGAYLSIDPNYPQARIDYMLKDSAAKFLAVADNQEGEKVRRWEGEKVFLEDISPSPKNTSYPLTLLPSYLLDSSNLAYVIYTSGSTGEPKGVMVNHRNVVRLVKNTNYVELNPGGSILQTGAVEFDASTFEIWGAILNDLKLVLVDKETILNPGLLKITIRKHNISMAWMTSALFNQLIKADIEIFAGLKNLLVGGDVLSPRHISQLMHNYPQLQVINGYGPTENTTFSTTCLVQQDYIENIPIGKPIANSTAYIIDKYNYLQPIGVPGELVVGGDGIARGYLNNPELTWEKFNFNRSYRSDKTNIFYKTGDLARWLPDGNIEFLGRADSQVKIRGFRIEPGEIENCLLKHKNITEALLVVNEDEKSEKSLTAYFIAAGELLESELKEYLQKELPEYMIPAYFVRLEKIPLTPNGKIDREALPKPVLKTSEAYTAPVHEIEKKLVEIWSEVLSRDEQHASQLQKTIGIDDNFFRLGGHSLKATALISRVYKEFNVRMPLVEIFKRPTVRGVFEYIHAAIGEKYILIEPVEEKEYYNLSSAQERLYFLQQMDLGSTAYHISSAWIVEGVLDKEVFAQGITQLIMRHESLRTSFEMVGEKLVQKVQAAVEFNIEKLTEVFGPTFFQKGGLIRPFDLSNAPLLRVGLLELEKNKHIFIIDMHHIITDGISTEVLIREFAALYHGEKLPGLRVRYRDYAEWQNRLKGEDKHLTQGVYWQNEFAGEIPVLDLPLDYPRPAVQDFAGQELTFYLESATVESLHALALETGTTLYMILLAIYNIFLAKLSGQEDIIVGTPVGGRRCTEIENLVGLFVNTLALRNYPVGEKNFIYFLGGVKEKTLAGFENQEYPYEDLVEEIGVNRDTGRNPLFDTMFALQNMGSSRVIIPGLSLTAYKIENKTAKFDLTLIGVEIDHRLEFTFEYSTKLFKPGTIDRFIIYFKTIITGVLANKYRRLADFESIPVEEKNRVLYEFNDVTTEFPTDKTIHELFTDQAERVPNHIALAGPSIRVDTDFVYVTYAELNRLANGFGELLCQNYIPGNNITAIMMPRSVELITGMLGIWKSGGAYLPVDPGLPQDRMDYILKDSQVKLLAVANRLEGEKVRRWEGEKNFEIIFLDFFSSSSSLLTSYLPNFLTSYPFSLAYIIYTSGSTGVSKGVAITHGNLCHLLQWGYQTMEWGPGDHVIQTLAYYFDWSAWEIFLTLTSGASLYMITEEILLNSTLQLDFIKKHDITVMEATPTRFQSLIAGEPGAGAVSATSAAGSAGALKRLRCLGIGAEKLTLSLIKQVQKYTAKDCRVFNMYGPTEATIISAAFEINMAALAEYEYLSSIPIGRMVGNGPLLVLDKYLNLCPVNVVGELYITGDGVGLGYVNNPELTCEKFKKHRSYRSNRTNIFYKTGDLVRWLSNGTIEYLGRRDHQVKIRGFRVELGEIENLLLGHKHIKDTVVVVKENSLLTAYYVSAEALSGIELRAYLAQKLPDYMIPAYFMQLEKIPLTANGKADRKALPMPQLREASAYVAPRNSIEMKLAEIWTGILDIDNAAQHIGIDDHFFHLGGHSLKATSLGARIYKEFHVKIPLKEFFQRSTIREMAIYINEAGKEEFAAVSPAEAKEYYPLSSAQKRLYFLYQLDPGNLNYNMPYLMPLVEDIPREKLEAVFRELIARHESLRTSFETINMEPVQVIHQKIDFSISQANIEESVSGDIEEIMARLTVPFDLKQAPLLRVHYLTFAVSLGHPRRPCRLRRPMLFIDMHHIITDGTSQSILAKEFAWLCAGKPLAPLALQYKDYSQWQRSAARQEAIKKQEAYWLKEFAGEIPILQLPADFPRPSEQSSAGNVVMFKLNAWETAALKAMAKENDVTLYMALLAIFTILLAKLSGQEDIIVGTPIAARQHPDLQPVIGMFVNTLAMRNNPSGEKTFKHYLQEVKRRTLAAYENQDYPFEDLVEHVAVERDIRRNPVFDVLFNLLNESDHVNDEIPLPGEPGKHRKGTAKFDMNWTISEAGSELRMDIEYAAKLFKPASIDRFISYFKNLVHKLPGENELKIANIEILGEPEKEEILKLSEGDIFPYDQKDTIPGLFADQVEKKPDNVALVGPSVSTIHKHSLQITYRCLNENAETFAQVLQGKGVGCDTIAAVQIERSLEMIIGILAILKAGGGYLPIDPGYPQERIDFMLKDSAASILLTNDEKKKTNNCPLSIVNSQLSKRELPFSHRGHHSNQLAYVIYTSGSTGQPKGVMLEQRNLINLLKFQVKYTNLDFSRVLQFTTISFDVSFQEIFSALLAGGQLFLIDKEIRADIPALLRLIEKNDIRTLFLPVSFLKVIFQEDEYFKLIPPCIEHMVAAGEQLVVGHNLKTYLKEKKVYLHNHYGPSETHVVTTLTIDPLGAIDEISEFPSIGKPLMNTGIYIMDKYGKLMPPGSAGEIWIGGEQVGRGYLNRPELTAEKFKKHRSYRSYKTYISFYKTGDLGRLLPDPAARGAYIIEFLGRMDHQVKIRGFRVEPGEIESRLAGYPGIKEAVIVVQEDKSDNYLCAYIVSGKECQASELREFLAKELPDYMVPSYFVQLDKIPLTPNGKIDRKVLPKPGLKIDETYIEPRDEIEKQLVEIWANVLEIEKESISIDTNFFQLGGHSLKLTMMKLKLHRSLNIEIPLKELFKRPTIEKIAEYIRHMKRGAKNKYAVLDNVEKKEYYELSSTQKQLFILEKTEISINTAYNLPGVMLLEGELDNLRFEDTVKALLKRHESFRTSFDIMQGKPVQLIHDSTALEMKYLTAQENEIEQIIKDFIKPFDLRKTPLLRAALVHLQCGKNLFLFDMHHIIADGVSMGILVRDFVNLYGGSTLPKLQVQYKDYAVWQNNFFNSDEMKKQEEYWLNKFKGNIPILNMPTDYPRPSVKNFEGNIVKYEIDTPLTNKIKTLIIEKQTTIYIALLAVFNILLSKYTGQDDIIAGCPTAGRNHPDLENIIGMFVNTLAMRNYPQKEKSAGIFLDEVKKNAWEAFENQDYPLEELVSKLKIIKNYNRNPLFDILFVSEKLDIPKLALQELTFSPYHFENKISHMDLVFYIEEIEEKIELRMEYAASLFKQSNIERLLTHYVEIIEQVVANINIKLADITISHDFLAQQTNILKENLDGFGF